MAMDSTERLPPRHTRHKRHKQAVRMWEKQAETSVQNHARTGHFMKRLGQLHSAHAGQLVQNVRNFELHFDGPGVINVGERLPVGLILRIVGGQLTNNRGTVPKRWKLIIVLRRLHVNLHSRHTAGSYCYTSVSCPSSQQHGWRTSPVVVSECR
jgi:hypothetical protein